MPSSFAARRGLRTSSLIDGVNDVCVVDVLDAYAAVFWLQSATSLTGLTLVPEISFDGTVWVAGAMHVTNQTTAAPILVSATLAAVPAYAFHVPSQGAPHVRLRASAITTGSVTCLGTPTDDESSPR